MSARVIGYDRASFPDLAICLTGDVETLLILSEDNGVSITDDVMLGNEYRAGINVSGGNPEILKRMEMEKIRPATALNASQVAACPYNGIGFMGIEIDFKVY